MANSAAVGARVIEIIGSEVYPKNDPNTCIIIILIHSFYFFASLNLGTGFIPSYTFLVHEKIHVYSIQLDIERLNKRVPPIMDSKQEQLQEYSVTSKVSRVEQQIS